MIYLSLEQVIALHDMLIAKFGGLSGIRERSLLESAIANPMTAVFGQEMHPTVFDKAASYLYSIARNHPFLDGNKRTASSCALIFLRYNGENPRYDVDEFLEFILDVAQGNKSHQEISEYLKKLCT
jgi:death on curing protein